MKNKILNLSWVLGELKEKNAEYIIELIIYSFIIYMGKTVPGQIIRSTRHLNEMICKIKKISIIFADIKNALTHPFYQKFNQKAIREPTAN